MKTFTCLVSLLPLTLFLTLPVDAAVGNAPKLIQEICAQLPHKDLCLSSLQSDPSSSMIVDESTLSSAAIRVAQANGTDTAQYIQSMINNATLEPGTQQALSDCSDSYVDAIQQLDDTSAAMTVKKYEDVYTFLKIAMGEIDSCEAGFQRLAGDNKNLLSGRNLVFRQLINNVMAVARRNLA